LFDNCKKVLEQKPQPESLTAQSHTIEVKSTESIEERKLRLKANRDALKKKKEGA